MHFCALTRLTIDSLSTPRQCWRPNRVENTNMARKKTGEISDITGNYAFDGYVDGSTFPPPTAEERVIPIERNETLPPVRSSNKAAWWKWPAA